MTEFNIAAHSYIYRCCWLSLIYQICVVHDAINSVDTCSEQEVLDDWHDLDLTKVKEKLIELLLIGAVEDQVGSEDEDASGEDRQDLEGLKADNTIEEKEDLIDLKYANE